MVNRSIDPLEAEVISEIEDQMGRSLPTFDWFAGNRIFGVRVIKDHVFLLLVNRRGLETLPTNIGRLSKLRALDVGRNKLTELPSSLKKCRTLSQVFAGRNRLKEFPSMLTSLPDLKILELQGNEIEYVPNLSSLTTIIRLYLNDNKLTEIPRGLHTLVELEDLRLDGNQLSDIVFPELPSLESLNLSNNYMKTVPKSVLKCQNLNSVNFSNNQLEEFPDFLVDLPDLVKLHLNGNPIDEISYDIIDQFPSLEQLVLDAKHFDTAEKEKTEAFIRLMDRETKIIWKR